MVTTVLGQVLARPVKRGSESPATVKPNLPQPRMDTEQPHRRAVPVRPDHSPRIPNGGTGCEVRPGACHGAQRRCCGQARSVVAGPAGTGPAIRAAMSPATAAGPYRCGRCIRAAGPLTGARRCAGGGHVAGAGAQLLGVAGWVRRRRGAEPGCPVRACGHPVARMVVRHPEAAMPGKASPAAAAAWTARLPPPGGRASARPLARPPAHNPAHLLR